MSQQSRDSSVIAQEKTLKGGKLKGSKPSSLKNKSIAKTEKKGNLVHCMHCNRDFRSDNFKAHQASIKAGRARTVFLVFLGAFNE